MAQGPLSEGDRLLGVADGLFEGCAVLAGDGDSLLGLLHGLVERLAFVAGAFEGVAGVVEFGDRELSELVEPVGDLTS